VKQIRKRLTYANVMSSLAVFLVLGGATAFAASKIGANQLKANSVKTGKIVKEAITTSKIKNNAVNGAKVNESTLGTVPSATTATTATTAGTASNVLWAVVENPAGVGNAKLVRSSQPAPTVIEGVGVDVVFNKSVAGCAWLATSGKTGEGVENAGFAQTGGTDGNANGVDVRTREDDGSITDASFHLAVICP
jgi:hypothetical protein